MWRSADVICVHAEIIGAAQPEASQDGSPPPRAADASPQLRAPPGRARGVILPRSTSPTPDAEAEAEPEAIAPLWDSAIWEKSNSDWQKARDVQEQHMREMAARREQDRAAAEKAAATEAQLVAARNAAAAALAAGEARRVALRKDQAIVLEASRAAARRQQDIEMAAREAAVRERVAALAASAFASPHAGGRSLGGVRPPITQTPPARPQPSWFKLPPAVQRPANHTQLSVQKAPNMQQAAIGTGMGAQRAPIVRIPATRTQLWAQGPPNVQRAATHPQLGAQKAPAVQRANSHGEWDALMAAACDAGGATLPIRCDAEAPKVNFRPSRPLTAGMPPRAVFSMPGDLLLVMQRSCFVSPRSI